MAEKVQDMPPEGGYRPLSFARIPAKSYFSGTSIILGYLALTAGGFFLFSLNHRKVKRGEVEERSSKLALQPLLVAERDRAYLKQLRRNVEEEEKLMANVEGWEVGTLYGEPIYKTLPEDAWMDPRINEFYAHANKKKLEERVLLQQWS